jgi:hypothetical protein
MQSGVTQTRFWLHEILILFVGAVFMAVFVNKDKARGQQSVSDTHSALSTQHSVG